MGSLNYRSIVLVILSLAVLWSSVPSSKAASLGGLVPPSFEVNTMAVSPQGDIAAGSFYALDPSIIPWDLTKPIYRYVGVTLIVNNFDNATLPSTAGINVTNLGPFFPYKVFLIIQGVQSNAPAIVSDIQTLFGMQSGSFATLVSNPLTLPVSIFGANITSTTNPYLNFVNKFVALTSTKSAMIGHYSASLLSSSSSGIIFNSLESLTYPIIPAFSSGAIASQVLGVASVGAAIAPAFGLNSTGVVVIHKKSLSFSLAADHTLGFGSLVGVTGGIYSTTNETFAASLPGGAQVTSFSPSNMLVQSSVQSTLVIGAFPWVGTASRLLPDVSVTFHYPAFNSPVLNSSWTTNPSTFSVGQAFALTLKVNNTGPLNAVNLHFTLAFTGVVLSSQQSLTSLQYSLASLPTGTTNSTLLNFQSFSPSPTFSLSAYFLDTQNFVYQWSAQFSPSPTVKRNGPLTVTKIISPATPSYGQVGNVNVTIHNTDTTATYYNIEDLNPDAQPFLYPSGVGNNPSAPRPCPYMVNSFFNPILANNTFFTFQVGNGLGCAPAVLTRVLLQHGLVPTTQVATPNQLVGQGEVWGPLKPFSIPGIALASEQLVLTLTFQNYGNITAIGSVNYSGFPLPQQGTPKASYLGVYCFPCTVPRGGSTTVSGALFNSTGGPILPSQTVLLSYRLANNTLRSLPSVTTNSTGGFSFNWSGVSQLPIGDYSLIANFTGSAQYNSAGVYIRLSVVTPVTISPGGYLTWSYPYFFNVTGPLSITPERIAYSSKQNATGTCQPLTGICQLLTGEYIAQSSSVPAVVGSPIILPVVDVTMNIPKVSLLYVAQNQSLVQVNVRVTNTGPLPATGVVVSSWVPRFFTTNNTSGKGIPHWLPVVSNGNVTFNASGTATLALSSPLLPGQQAYGWYVVKANSTNLYEIASNVTAQSGPNQYKFYYVGPVLGVYGTTSSISQPRTGLLQAYTTVDPAVVANKTSTTVSVHLYNAGNVTYTNINATVGPNYPGAQMTFTPTWKLVPNMAPGTSQTVNFTGTATAKGFFFIKGVSTYYLSGAISYNQSSTIHFTTNFSQTIPIYDPTGGFNPSLRVDISGPTQPVQAGATALVTVTVKNTGSSSLTNFAYFLLAYSPLFNPQGPSQPEISYGSYFTGWPYSLGAGQSISFRVGIQTSAGGLYPVFASQINYYHGAPGSTVSDQQRQISASSAVLVTATDTTPPTVSTPWSSPFAPTSSDQVHVWTQVYDGSGVGYVNLEYSTDKLSWTSVPMTPLFGSYAKAQGMPYQQPFFGDIYNVTLPAKGPGAAVFYRIRATDSLGNTGLQDNNGNDYVYFIQGGNSWLFNQSPGTNSLLNGTQFVPGVKTTIMMNVSIPIAVQVIQLSTNPGGSPPTGLTALGVYTQVNANLSITLDARIRFYYTTAQINGLDPITITPYFWDGTKWTALDNVVRNPGQNYVEGTVHHFSLFGLFASPQQTSTAAPFPWLIIGVVVAVALVAVVGGILGAKRRKRGTPTLVPTPSSTPPSIPGTPTPP